MFTVDYNSQNPEANVLVKQQDIFQNTLTIKSVHCYYNTVQYNKDYDDFPDENGIYRSYMRSKKGSICCSPHRDVPIDIVYKSTPQGEYIYITLWGNPTSKRLILNIDGKSNIDLIRQENIRDDFGIGDWSSAANDSATGEKRYEKECQRFYQQEFSGQSRIYFELTREQLEKLCSAKTLYIQTSSHYNEVQFEGDASGFITILQALYNEAIDNAMYINSKADALSLLESETTKIQANNDVEMSKKTEFDNNEKTKNTIIITIACIFTIILFIFMLSTCGG